MGLEIPNNGSRVEQMTDARMLIGSITKNLKLLKTLFQEQRATHRVKLVDSFLEQLEKGIKHARDLKNLEILFIRFCNAIAEIKLLQHAASPSVVLEETMETIISAGNQIKTRITDLIDSLDNVELNQYVDHEKQSLQMLNAFTQFKNEIETVLDEFDQTIVDGLVNSYNMLNETIGLSIPTTFTVAELVAQQAYVEATSIDFGYDPNDDFTKTLKLTLDILLECINEILKCNDGVKEVCIVSINTTKAKGHHKTVSASQTATVSPVVLVETQAATNVAETTGTLVEHEQPLALLDTTPKKAIRDFITQIAALNKILGAIKAKKNVPEDEMRHFERSIGRLKVITTETLEFTPETFNLELQELYTFLIEFCDKNAIENADKDIMAKIAQQIKVNFAIFQDVVAVYPVHRRLGDINSSELQKLTLFKDVTSDINASVSATITGSKRRLNETETTQVPRKSNELITPNNRDSVKKHSPKTSLGTQYRRQELAASINFIFETGLIEKPKTVSLSSLYSLMIDCQEAAQDLAREIIVGMNPLLDADIHTQEEEFKKLCECCDLVVLKESGLHYASPRISR